MDRFWDKVDKSGDCWMWTAYKDQKGYGRFGIGSKLYSAHRLSYEWSYGDFDKKLCVCHTCDNPGCVNPEHLWLGTRRDNNIDRDNKGRHNNGFQDRIKCKNGHAFNTKNTYTRPDGGRNGRNCRVCDKLYQRSKRAKAKSTREAVREDIHG